MANNGSFNTQNYDGRYLRFSWNVASQSVAQNKTTINWSLKGAGGNSYSWYMAGNFKVIINGSTVYSSSTRIKLYNGTTVASGSFTINHNNDGSKKFSAHAEAGIYYVAVNCRGDGSWWLPTIARATQPTTNKSTIYFGDNITIYTPRASSSFHHTIQAGVDGHLNFTNIATNVGTQKTWTLPKSWAQYIKTANKKLRIRALTYSGGTHIGTKEVSPQITVKATDDMKPIVNITLSDDNNLLNQYGGFVRGQSKIRAKVTETLYNGTTVKSRSLTLDGVNYQTNEAVSNVITSVNQVVNASVTDARNMTGHKTENPIVHNWYAPKFIQTSFSRCTNEGELDNSGNFIRIDYQVDIAPVNNLNSKNLKIKFKKQGTETWSNRDVTLSDYTQTGHEVIPAGGEYSWDLKLELTDDFATNSINEVVGTVFVLMDFHKSGKGISIGKVSELTETFEIDKDWNLKVYGKLLKDYIRDTLYPVGSFYISSNSANPATLFGGKWQKIEGRFLLGSNNKYSLGSTGGEEKHKLTIAEMPSHNHPIRSGYGGNGGSDAYRYQYWAGHSLSWKQEGNLAAGYRGGNQPHNNMPPYLAVNIWKRTQ